MGIQGAVAPVVYGGKLRAILAYLDRAKLQARDLSPVDVMNAIDNYNIFLPTGDAKFGPTDYAIDSNSMYELVDRMGDIPIHAEHGNATFLRDVAVPKDANFIQTNVVRINGRREVYIPVYRQLGASTLNVVDGLKAAVPDMQTRLTRPDIDLKVVMDQSIYVRHSIESLIEEGVLGAVLCSLVILIFLGRVADDHDRHHDDPDFGAGRVRRLVLHGQYDQRDDAGGPVAWRSARWSTTPLFVWKTLIAIWDLGDSPIEGRLSWRQRGRRCRNWSASLLHAVGAGSLGTDARNGRVSVSADGDGRGVRHDRGYLLLSGRSCPLAVPAWLKSHDVAHPIPGHRPKRRRSRASQACTSTQPAWAILGATLRALGRRHQSRHRRLRETARVS